MSFDLREYRDDESVDLFAEPDPALGSGSFLFDYLTGVGGLPRGRIIEAFGKESSGKSTIFYQAIAAAQRQGGVGVLLDYENAFVPSYGEACGMDVHPSKLLVETPRSLEAGFIKALALTKKAGETGTPLVVLFDSLEAMPLTAEGTEEDPNSNNMIGAWRAKAIGSHLRNAVGHVSDAGAIWVLINHEKDVIHTGFVSPSQKALAGSTRTPGGRGPKYYSSIRFQFTPARKIKAKILDPVSNTETEQVVAQTVRVTTVKNKVAAPNRSVVLTIRYGSGVDNVSDIVTVGLAHGLITRKGKAGSISIPNEAGEVIHEVRSLEEACEYLRSEPELAEALEAVLAERLVEAATPSEAVEDAGE